MKVPADASGTMKLPVYPLCFVCEDENGTCLYLRQDVRVNVEVLTEDDAN